MRLVTWNVNGIRSLKKNINCILSELDSDVTCFQETKISRSQLPENIALVDGYTSYFSYPRKQSGYSGVATYSRDKYVPEDAEEGLSGILGGKDDDSLINNIDSFEESAFDLAELDSEGRVIITYHLIKFEDEVRHLAVINVYCPRVDPEKPERQLFKMQFCHLLEAKAKKLIEDGCFVVIVGDLNIACSIIDHCDPGDENEFNSSVARQWLKKLLSSKIGYFNGAVGIVDAFRHMYPDRKNAYTCWNVKTGARLTNFGTRIDYILISSNLQPLLYKCEIMSDYEGSDHCPVIAELKCDSLSDKSVSLPSICTRLWPEFSGKQQTLQSFFKKTQYLSNNSTKMSETNEKVGTSKENQIKFKNKQKSITNFFKSPNTAKKFKFSDTSIPDELQDDVSSSKSENEDYISNSQNSVLNISAEEEKISSSPRNTLVSEWKSVLKGPPKPPLCSGHSKLCVLRTVKKKGPNLGRQFFMCSQPAGHSSNPDANCNYFKWVTAAKISTLK